MKVKSGFNLRNVCGEEIIVAEGEENIDFSNIVSMNESSVALWKEAQRLVTFTVDDLVTFLCSLYDVDEATAKTDVTEIVAQWGVVGIIEGDDIPVSAKKEAVEEKMVVASQQEVETPKKKGFFSRLFGK